MSQKKKHRKPGKNSHPSNSPRPVETEQGIVPQNALAGSQTIAVNGASSAESYHNRTPRWKTGLEVAGILFGIAYAIVTFFLWRDAHTNFVTDQRAWIGFDGFIAETSYPQANKPLIIQPVFRNTGKTPAIDVRVRGMAEPVPSGGKPSFIYRVPPESKGTVTPGASFHTGLPEAPSGLSQEELARLTAGDKSLFFFADVTYRDVFTREPHKICICYYLHKDLQGWEWSAYSEGNSTSEDTQHRGACKSELSP